MLGRLPDLLDSVADLSERVVEADEGFLERFDDLAVVALMPGRIGDDGKIAIDDRLGERSGVVDKVVDRVDAGVQVVLDRVEIAIVSVGDLLWDPPFEI